MTGWTAIVPIKPAPDRKSRLGPHLAEPDRIALTEFMLHHVLAVLARAESVRDIAILSTAPPDGWTGRWLADRGEGLNAELRAAAALCSQRLIVIHADLPALMPEDVDALARGAERGVAIAPDRHLRGTNALAADDPGILEFHFGIGSFARHREAMPAARIVRRPGLQNDIDDWADYDGACRQGLLPTGMMMPAWVRDQVETGTIRRSPTTLRP